MRMLLMCVAVAALAKPCHAATTLCPPEVTVTQEAQAVPDGLRAFNVSDGHRLISIQFSDGPPDERAWLAPTRTNRRGKQMTGVWEFTASARPIWIACTYGATSIVLAFPLPAAVRRCEVPFDTGFSPPVAERLDCK